MKKNRVQDIGLSTLNTKGSESDWLISYSDVVTVLLIFFIIFFNVDTVKKKENKQLIELDKEYIMKMEQSTNIAQQFEKVLLGDARIIPGEKHFEIAFQGESFFDSGSTEINDRAKKLIDNVVKNLRPHQDKVFLQIRGYTDDLKVRYRKNRWWQNNMELSMLRALKVYNYMKKSGIKKENLSVAGYASHKNSGHSHLTEGEKLRRVSFYIAMREENKDSKEQK